MKGIIWYINNEIGLQELENIKNNYQKRGINFIQYTSQKRGTNKDEYIIFENGDQWRTCFATDSMRGAACNISLIESNIPQNTIDTIIKPCTKALPYRAFNFYSSDLGVDVT